MSKEKTLKDRVLNYIYYVSKKPILLRDLLMANRQYNEGMYVDPVTLGFRLRLARAYLVYILIVLAILIPLSIATHTLLANIDSHISILGAMLITAIIFIGFNFFKARMRDSITLFQIKTSWKIHFPLFSYDEYSTKVEEIFEQALREEVSKRDLKRYILDNLTD